MKAGILGRGWRFPIFPDEQGKLRYSQGEENVEHSMRLLLLTALGDRVMRPDFGTEAPSLVFAPGSQQHLTRLETTVRDAVRDWEPRVDLLDARAEADPDRPWRVLVSVDYLVRRTNSRMNLVFPYYLGATEAAP